MNIWINVDIKRGLNEGLLAHTVFTARRYATRVKRITEKTQKYVLKRGEKVKK